MAPSVAAGNKKNPAGRRGIKFRGTQNFLVFIDPDKTDLDVGLNWFSLDKSGHWIWTVFSWDGLVGFSLDLDVVWFFFWIRIHILCS